MAVVLLWTSASYIEVSRFQSQLCSQFQLSVHVTLVHVFNICHPLEKPRCQLWLLALAWPNPDYCGHLESELGKGDICLSLYLLFLKIIRHKLIKIKCHIHMYNIISVNFFKEGNVLNFFIIYLYLKCRVTEGKKGNSILWFISQRLLWLGMGQPKSRNKKHHAYLPCSCQRPKHLCHLG